MKLFRRTRPTPELRRCYRRFPGVPLDVQLLLGGSALSVACRDLSLHGVGVLVDHALPVPRRLEREVLGVRLGLPRRQAPVTSEAIVICERSLDEGRHLGLRFRDHERLASQLARTEFRLFNRRQEPRVPPSPGERLPLQVAPGGLALRVLVHDLSRGGVGFYVDAGGEAALAGRAEWPAQLRLPGQQRPLEVLLELRHVTPVAGGFRIGACFREQRRRSHLLLRAEVGDYVRVRRDRLQRHSSWTE